MIGTTKCCLLFVSLLILVPGAAADHHDPLEKLNRVSQRINDFADDKFLRPSAKAYRKLPDPVEFAIGNVFGNLADVGDAVNNFLQGKPGDGLSDLLRVTVNSTVGIGGLFDPASKMGLIDHDEDFAQTLATWGVPRGAYIVIPLLGPSSVRDVFARPVTSKLDPLMYLYPVDHRNTTIALRLVDQRAGLLAADSVIFGDRYIFYREAYQQRREYLEKDGEIEDPFGDDF